MAEADKRARRRGAIKPACGEALFKSFTQASKMLVRKIGGKINVAIEYMYNQSIEGILEYSCGCSRPFLAHW